MGTVWAPFNWCPLYQYFGFVPAPTGLLPVPEPLFDLGDLEAYPFGELVMRNKAHMDPVVDGPTAELYHGAQLIDCY